MLFSIHRDENLQLHFAIFSPYFITFLHSRVDGSPHTKNQLHSLRYLATIHECYTQSEGQTDKQMDLLWHRPDTDSGPKSNTKIKMQLLIQDA